MKKIIGFLFLSFISFNLFAQIDQRIAKTNIPLDQVQQIIMPEQNNEALLEKELSQRKTGRIDQFAVPFDVNITTDQKGTWEQLADGTDIWRMRIQSKEAKSINLGFTKYNMPKGGKLILYSSDYQIVRGPFTEADNEVHGQLWTPLIFSDEIVIEVHLEKNTRDKLELELGAINHDFVGLSAISSGACNLDALCGDADGWGIVDDYRDIINSVAMMTVNGFNNCTGFLINNVEQDCTPYFMSAYHCGVTPGSASTIVAYWNFQNSVCRQPNSPESGQAGDGNFDTFNSGTVYRAGWEDSDFILFEFDDEVNPEAQAFLPGWTRAEDELPTSAICVHHPSNCEKRISFEDDLLYRGAWTEGAAMIPTGDHLIVPDWDIGTTEGGSSGSPLFNQDKLVVGQLHGGAAGCGNDEYDAYGWFAVSWEGGGTPATRLKDWLDPNNTGVVSIPGKSCSFSIDLSSSFENVCSDDDVAVFDVTGSTNFQSPITLTVNNVPNNATAVLGKTTIDPGETTTLTISNISALNTDLYSIEVLGVSGTDSGSSLLSLNVFANEPIKTTLVAPTHMDMTVSIFPVYEWSKDIADQSYELEVATDLAFTNVVDFFTDYRDNIYEGIILDANTDYYWRVRANNTCGMGEWSTVSQFRTAVVSCANIESNNVPVTIAENAPNTITSSINIPFAGEIIDVNVSNIRGTHTWVSDLIFSLISPSGTEIILIDRECGPEIDFDIGFDDQAVTNSLPCPMTTGGLFQPATALSIFNGEDSQGTWLLKIEDTFSVDGGTLEGWSLEICSNTVTDFSVTTSIVNETLCVDDDLSFDVVIGSGFTGPVMLTATSEPATNLTILFQVDPSSLMPGQIVTATLNNLSNLLPGSNVITFIATDGTNTINSNPVTIELIDIPTATMLGTPNNESINVDLMPLMAWQTVAGVEDYTVEIATDNQFSNIVETITVNGTSYIPTAALALGTEHYWKVTANNKCGNTSSDVFSFTTTTMVSIQELPENTISLYPNPTDGMVNVIFNQEIVGDFEIELYSIHGKLIKHQRYDTSTNGISLDLSNQNSGIYLVKLVAERGILTKRIALQK